MSEALTREMVVDLIRQVSGGCCLSLPDVQAMNDLARNDAALRQEIERLTAELKIEQFKNMDECSRSESLQRDLAQAEQERDRLRADHAKACEIIQAGFELGTITPADLEWAQQALSPNPVKESP